MTREPTIDELLAKARDLYPRAESHHEMAHAILLLVATRFAQRLVDFERELGRLDDELANVQRELIRLDDEKAPGA